MVFCDLILCNTSILSMCYILYRTETSMEMSLVSETDTWDYIQLFDVFKLLPVSVVLSRICVSAS